MKSIYRQSLMFLLLPSLLLVLCSCSDSSSHSATGASATADSELVQMEDFSYLGAFRLPGGTYGVSSVDYAIGPLAYNPDHHSIFFAGHDHHHAIAEFAIPELSLSDDLLELNVADAPLQDFISLLDLPAEGNPDTLNRVTGMLYLDGQLIVNAENWYDASGDNRDTTLVATEGNDLSNSAIEGYFELEGAARAGGYMAPIPDEWQASFGANYLTGWSSVYSIISRYSVGPTLFTFDPQDMLTASAGSNGTVATTPFLNYAYGSGHYLSEDALVNEEGGASDLWNYLSNGVYGFIVPGTSTFAVFGSSGGINSGIGYKITQDNGNLCGGYCAYAADDYYNYYWFFDVREILVAEHPYDLTPYAYGSWLVPFDDNGRHAIIGGTFDEEHGVLYLTLSKAGQVGTYDRPPVIVAFRIP